MSLGCAPLLVAENRLIYPAELGQKDYSDLPDKPTGTHGGRLYLVSGKINEGCLHVIARLECARRRCPDVSPMSRVLIADDHAVVRSGYKQFLEGDTSIVEIGEAANGQETLEQLRAKEWDLLLMDIHMPDRSGLDILQHVTAAYPAVRVLVMSGLPEEQYARNVLRAGASGYSVQRRHAPGIHQGGAANFKRSPLRERHLGRVHGRGH